MAGWRRGCTRGVYCALPLYRNSFEKEGTQETCRRGGARQNRAASTLAVKPAHAPRIAPRRSSGNYVIMFAAVVLPNRVALRWTPGYRFLACFICNIASDQIGRDHISRYTIQPRTYLMQKHPMLL